MKTKWLVWTALLAVMVACDPQIDFRPIDNTPEEQEAVINDFTLIKACLGKSQADAATLLLEHGYSASEIKKNAFYKTENEVPKEVHIYVTTNGAISGIELIDTGVDTDEYFNRSKGVFIQWLRELHDSKAYSRMVRNGFALRTLSEETSFASLEELISALNGITSSENFTYSEFTGNDIYANQYSFVFYPQLKCNYMQIYNRRTGQPDDNFTESDLTESDLKKHILISKVDYLTFRYKGFYALNVSGKVDTDSLIPIVSEFQSPGDFGYIKLYYRDKSSLLMDGTIVWNGCGQLAYPETFRAGLTVKDGLPYPGEERIACLNAAGNYLSLQENTMITENDIQHIWQTLSHQKEFQHYYGNSTKKIAVYLYAPSVGMFDPAAAYYLIFTEQ